MADPDHRAFHLAAAGLAVVAGLLGVWVTTPHPLAWFFGVLALVAVLGPAELVFLVRERPRSRAKETRAVTDDAGDEPFSLLGRALAAARTLRADETLRDALHEAAAVLDKRAGESSPVVEELRVTLRQTTERLERHARDENPDPVMLGPKLGVYRAQVKAAIVKAEQR